MPSIASLSGTCYAGTRALSVLQIRGLGGGHRTHKDCSAAARLHCLDWAQLAPLLAWLPLGGAGLVSSPGRVEATWFLESCPSRLLFSPPWSAECGALTSAQLECSALTSVLGDRDYSEIPDTGTEPHLSSDR